MIKLFELEKVHVTAAMFDPKKLAWMNGEYVKKIPHESFKAVLKKAATTVGGDPRATRDESWWDYLVAQVQPRTKFLKDVESSLAYLVTDDFEYDPKAVEKRLAKDGVKAIVLDLVERFSKLDDWTAPSLQALVKGLSQGKCMGPWVHPIRVAVSGRGEGIGLFEMLQLLGKEKTLARLTSVAEKFCK